MQAEWVIHNPQASMPLRVKLDVECNTPGKDILANVIKNSRHIKKWVKSEPAHDGVAVVVGGGPSLADTIDELKAIKGKIFALNAAATFLAGHGIKADYQVIMDAREETASLIGPAKDYLFASQVHPKCFRKKPKATLWHATYGNVLPTEQENFPEHSDGYVTIGGSVSVGNTCLALLYAMGYRKIHVFGMDSSHRGASGHAYRQDMNDGEPCTVVQFNGKEYVCSLTMSLQAKYFMKRAAQLRSAGCMIDVHGSGLLPDMWKFALPLATGDALKDETLKYERIWQFADYREFSPGMALVDDFLAAYGIGLPAKIIDFGCGTGRPANRLWDMGHDVIGIDIAENCLDPDIHVPFLILPLWDLPDWMRTEYGFCTDVMEHIPPEKVDDVLMNLSRVCKFGAFFQIAFVAEPHGPELLAQDLHLTLHPAEWWRECLLKHFDSVEVKAGPEHWRSVFICKKGKSA